MDRSLQDRFRGCLLGLACGDAVGTTVEFKPRGTFSNVRDMLGGGPFGLKAGEWTDDTSMALCLASSLTEEGAFDPVDQMERYVRWWKEGYLSSTGRCFDVGNTVRTALERFTKSGNPFSGSTDLYSSGNGCIMRLAPVPMFCYPDEEMAIALSGESSRTTHGSRESVEASRLFGWMLCRALDGKSKEEILFPEELKPVSSGDVPEAIQAIARGEYREKAEDQVLGTGYVVKSLEAALWCFYHAYSFEEAVLRAVNLGDDADSTGAVCGQIAGAWYGMNGIPERWLAKLAMSDEIIRLADALLKVGPERRPAV